VAAIGEIAAPHPSGLAVQAITIAADGEERWTALEACDHPRALVPAQIARRVARAGIVGLGGAAFPAAVKLGAQVATLLINGGECEPYLSCDDRLMRERAAGIMEGIALIARATGASRVLVGIEDDKPEAIAAMRAAASPDIQVRAVPARYPMGSEKQLILTLTGREVPAGGRPADIGVLVHNVGTALAVREAVRHGRPLVSRLVTVNGGCVRAPGNVEVPIGALAAEVLAFCGGLIAPPARLLLGGPMMGLALPSARVPVVKGTSGILALTEAEVAEQAPGPCIRCASCVRACPVGLLPLDMARHVGAGDLPGAMKLGLKDCIACGCCAYVCPARIPLVQYFHHAKGELAARERAKQLQERTKHLAQARTARLEREAQEKSAAAARRKAEREAAKAKHAAEASA
jgi:electron transport complex protein RnfC